MTEFWIKSNNASLTPVILVFGRVNVLKSSLTPKVTLVELKAVKAIDDIHRAQCMNYLKATGHTVCLLINFGSPKLEVKRIVNNF